MNKLTIIFLSMLLCCTLNSGFSYAQSNLALKICSNSTKGTLTARSKCKKGEQALVPTSFTGPQGLQGPSGVSGPSAFDNIPSGKTVFGVIGFDGDNSTAGADFYALASLPAKTSQVFVNEDILIAPSSVLNNDCSGSLECRDVLEVTQGEVCTGSIQTPTAPSGKVCIYVSSINGSNTNSGSLAGFVLPMSNPTITPGFRVRWNATNTGDTYLTAVWAYTAP